MNCLQTNFYLDYEASAESRPLFSVTCVTRETGNTLRMRANNAK